MPRPFWLIACLVLFACHAGVGRDAPRPRPPPWAEVWVDGAAPAGGDGSEARPYRSPREVLARPPGTAPLRVHLAPGRYPGPLVLPAGGQWVGTQAVLLGEGEETVVTALGGAGLSGVLIDGGGWGLEAGGAVHLDAVRFAGQRQGALRMGAGALTVTGGRFEAAGPEVVGLRVEGGRARLVGSVFAGPFHRAVEARRARVEWESVRVGEASTALHQSEGEARLTRVTVEGGSEVGLFVERGTLRLEDVTVTGHEFGLQTLHATLVARGFTSVGSARAGVALLDTRGDLEDVRVRGSGDFGAVSLLGSDTVLRGLQVEGAQAYGLSATRGRLRLEGALISGLSSRDGDSGDGLHLRDVEVEAHRLVVRDVAGAGVLAAQGARVVLREASLVSCRTAGVWSETLAQVTSEGLEVRGSRGPALVALDNGGLRVEDLLAGDNAGGLVVADCEGDTRVTLGRVKGPVTAGAPGGPCVTGPSP